METIGSAIDQVRTTIGDKTGKPEEGMRYPRRLIYDYLADAQYKVIREKIVANLVNPHDFYLEGFCVDLVKAPLYECPGLTPVGFNFLKSKHPLPKPLQGQIFSVISQGRKFTQTTFEDMLPSGPDILEFYEQTDMYCVRVTNEKPYLMIGTTLHLENVFVRMIPDSAMEAAHFPMCGQEPPKCVYYPSLPFKLDKDLKYSVIQLTAAALLNFSRNPLGDVKDNDQDETANSDPNANRVDP